MAYFQNYNKKFYMIINRGATGQFWEGVYL